MSARPARPVALVLAVTLLALLALLIGTPAASAHDVLVGTSPAADATVGRTPSAVVLTFDQPAVALGTQVVVTGPSGEVQDGSPRLVDETVTQDLQGGAPAGAYTVAWRVTSADGHPVSGTFTFRSSAAGAGEPPPATDPQTADPMAATGVPGSAVWLVGAVLVVVAGAVVTVVVRRRRRAGDGGAY